MHIGRNLALWVIIGLLVFALFAATIGCGRSSRTAPAEAPAELVLVPVVKSVSPPLPLPGR